MYMYAQNFPLQSDLGYPATLGPAHIRISDMGDMLKGELRNRFNIISEERVKFSEQNSENLMKIG